MAKDKSIKQVIDELLEKYQGINILTCRKFTTGTDIPQVGHINLFDKISSPNQQGLASPAEPTEVTFNT